MKHYFPGIPFLFMINVIWSQNVLYVGYDLGLPTAYSTIQSAVDAASSGDTIMVQPYVASLGSATITKKLVIIGTGYKITEQEDSLGIKTITSSSILSNITFNTGSDSSKIMGCEVNSININQPVKYVSAIRNHTNYIRINGADSITVKGCFISSYHNGSPYRYGAIDFKDTSKGSICANNICASESGNGILVDPNSDALIQRNVIMSGAFNIQNSVIVDNITKATSANTNNSTVTNNIFLNDLSQYAGNNQVNVGTTDIFVGYPTQGTYSFDKRWELHPSSPAIGYAFDGGDCGAFDGDDAYKLSGIPQMPVIYELTNTGAVIIENDSLHVNIKIRSEN